MYFKLFQQLFIHSVTKSVSSTYYAWYCGGNWRSRREKDWLGPHFHVASNRAGKKVLNKLLE